MIKKTTSSLNVFQLSTFDNTSSFKSKSINNFCCSRDIEISFSKRNFRQRNINLFRKNQSFCLNALKLSNKLFDIENALQIDFRLKEINSRINKANIVHEKRVRKSKDFANTTWISEKMKKIFVFHTTMMIVFDTKTSKIEIKMTLEVFKTLFENFRFSGFSTQVFLISNLVWRPSKKKFHELQKSD
jgi:hypothetical protein